VNEGIVDKSGAWFSYGDVRLGQGRENSKQFIKDNADLFAEIRQKVLDKKGVLKPGAKAEVAALEETEDDEVGGDGE
jgi:recombination protein RecA